MIHLQRMRAFHDKDTGAQPTPSHDTPNVGNHSVKAPLNIGIANAGPNSPPALDWSCRYSR